jgi:hypothetical protein
VPNNLVTKRTMLTESPSQKSISCPFTQDRSVCTNPYSPALILCIHIFPTHRHCPTLCSTPFPLTCHLSAPSCCHLYNVARPPREEPHTYLLAITELKLSVDYSGSAALYSADRSRIESPSGASAGQFLLDCQLVCCGNFFIDAVRRVRMG